MGWAAAVALAVVAVRKDSGTVQTRHRESARPLAPESAGAGAAYPADPSDHPHPTTSTRQASPVAATRAPRGASSDWSGSPRSL